LGEDIVTKIEIIFNDPRAEGRGVPEYGSVGAAGLDLRSCDNWEILPGEIGKFPMGYALYIGDHTLCGMILPRSGLGVRGILPANVLGLIDSDYQGELVVYLKNHSNEPFLVQNGDRIAQLVFMPVEHVMFSSVLEFSHITERGTGGFGSTGNG
jgi:dUTP pyrophosphatase